MRQINKIIVHCSATKEGRDFDVEDVRNWHVKGNKWKDIGYHYVIKLDGTIQKGRDVSVVGSHAYGYNKDSIGICYIGGLDSEGNAKDTRTKQQKYALRSLYLELFNLYQCEIIGHNEVSKKSCPCFNVQTEL